MTAWLTPEGGASRSSPAGLSTEDVARIDTALEAPRALSTIHTYSHAWRGFECWGYERGSTPLPAAPDVVSAYITSRVEPGLTMGMVTGTLAAIAHRHGGGGMDNPSDSELVRRVRRGLRRIVGVALHRRARPVLVEGIRRLVVAVDRAIATAGRHAALILRGFASALRRSERAAQDVEGISPNRAGC